MKEADHISSWLCAVCSTRSLGKFETMGTGVVANHSIANAHIRSDPLDQNGLTIETNDRDR